MEDGWAKYIISGIFSASITKTGISPFVRVKTLMQIQTFHNTNNYTNLYDSLKHIVRNEGFKGLYKGNMINITKAVPNYCMKFTINEYYLKYLIEINNCKNLNELQFSKLLEAGVLTGIVQTSLIYPIDLIRTRIIQDKQMLGREISIQQCAREIVRKGGVFALYNGFSPTIISAPIYVGLSLANFQYLRGRDDILSNTFIAGSIAGVSSQALTYPGDTIKKQLQINGMNSKKYTGLVDCIRKMYRSNGMGSFYRGFAINTAKAAPELGLKFFVYESFKQYL